MRKFLIGAALAASSLIAVAPAAAQWAPQPYGYNGYNGYNNGNGRYGYNNGYNGYTNGSVMISRVNRIRQQINFLTQRNALSYREASQLDREAGRLQERVQRRAWDGLSPNERGDIERRIAQLEQRVRINANDRDGHYNRNYNSYNSYNGYNNGYNNGYRPY